MEMISARLLEQRHGTPDGESDPMPTQDVIAHVRARVRGVDAKTAQERTRAFFRSSANDWALVLS
jgi:hypothetical protein